MSRVDEDREAQRLEEQRQWEKREAEARVSSRKASESTFARLVQEGQGQQQKSAGQEKAAMQDVFRKLKEEQEALLRKEAAPEESQAQLLGQKRTLQEGKAATQRGEAKAAEERASQGKASGQRTLSQGLAAKGQQASHQGAAEGQRRGEGRAQDGARTREALEERSAHHLKGPGGPPSGEAKEAQGKADPDGGGTGHSGQGGGEQRGGGGMGQTFRLNPALMPPVPVAQKRDGAGSERLRRMASEIAQKIVERARVGTNALGAVEFQMDLRSDVLKGLSIKVSAQKGRVQMVFAGADKDLLRSLEEESKSLKEALTARGLTVDALKFEATA